MEDDSQYLIPVNSPVELARLFNQGAQATKEQGYLIPDIIPIPPVLVALKEKHYRILDLACGPGGWACDVACRYCDSEVIGADISKGMNDYAMATAVSQDIPNVTFDVVDMNKPLPYQDASFYIVNMRFAVGCVPQQGWMPLLKEIRRILIPGGYVVSTETEIATSSSASFNILNQYTARVLHERGFGFSSTGDTLALIDALPNLIYAAGFSSVEFSRLAIPFSRTVNAKPFFTGSENYASWTENFRLVFLQLKPLMVQCGFTTDEGFDALWQEFYVESQDVAFKGRIPMVTFIGCK